MDRSADDDPSALSREGEGNLSDGELVDTEIFAVQVKDEGRLGRPDDEVCPMPDEPASSVAVPLTADCVKSPELGTPGSVLENPGSVTGPVEPASDVQERGMKQTADVARTMKPSDNQLVSNVATGECDTSRLQGRCGDDQERSQETNSLKLDTSLAQGLKSPASSSLSSSSSESSEISSSDSSSDSESDSSSDSERQRAAWDADAADANDDEAEDGGVVRSKNEQDEEAIPIAPVSLEVTDEMKLVPIGRVKSMLPRAVIIESLPGVLCPTPTVNPYAQPSDGISDARALDADTILCLSEMRVAFGRVFDTFGPVKSPFYLVRFNSDADIEKHGEALAVGKEVSYVAGETHFVRAGDLRTRGYDSSNLHDEELSGGVQDYSDDEAEAAAKRAAKRPSGRVVATGVPPGHGCRPNKRHQRRGGLSTGGREYPGSTSYNSGQGYMPRSDDGSMLAPSDWRGRRGRGRGRGRGRPPRGMADHWRPDGGVMRGMQASGAIPQNLHGPPVMQDGMHAHGVHPMMAQYHFEQAYYGQNQGTQGGWSNIQRSGMGNTQMPGVNTSPGIGVPRASHAYASSGTQQPMFMPGVPAMSMIGMMPPGDAGSTQGGTGQYTPHSPFMMQQHALQQQAAMAHQMSEYRVNLGSGPAGAPGGTTSQQWMPPQRGRGGGPGREGRS